jgi:hypothetical protein
MRTAATAARRGSIGAVHDKGVQNAAIFRSSRASLPPMGMLRGNEEAP